jgi:hypothetical protein
VANLPPLYVRPGCINFYVLRTGGSQEVTSVVVRKDCVPASVESGRTLTLISCNLVCSVLYRKSCRFSNIKILLPIPVSDFSQMKGSSNPGSNPCVGLHSRLR